MRFVGTALAVRLEQAGYDCVGVHTRSRASYQRFCRHLPKKHLALEELVPQVDALFITTQDSNIQQVAERLAELELAREGQLWIHCSGSLSSEVLRVREDLSVCCLSLHPLQSFASVNEALHILEGTHFGVEGEAEEEGEQIVYDLGGIPHRLKPEGKSLYHAGAVFASNYMVILASLAVELFELAGIDGKEALDSLLPLMKGTLHNLSRVKLPQALTGPVARGDVEVIKGHLKHMPPEIAQVYRTLGLHALELGKAKMETSGSAYPPAVWSELKTLFAGEDPCKERMK